MRRLPLVLLFSWMASAVGCGGQQHVDPVPDPGPQQADPLDAEEGQLEETTPEQVQAAELDALLQHLASTPAHQHPELLEGLSGETLEGILHRMPEGARPWALLRLALLADHHREPRKARSHLAAAVALASGHPAAARIEAVRQRLEAQSTVAEKRLGVLLPLSGPFGAIGKSALPAVKIAARAAGVELVVEDTAGKADQAAIAVERLVYTHRVPAIIGPIGSLESEAAARAAQRLRVPLLTLTSEEDITRLGGFIFRHRLTRSAQARTLARYAVQRMGLKRFAILYPDTAHGRAMTQSFWRTVESLGGEIRGAQRYGVHDVDFSTPIKKLIGRHELSIRRRDKKWVKLNRKARDRALQVAPVVDFEALFIPDRGRRLRTLLPYLAYWDIELKTDPEMRASDLRGKYGGRTPQLVNILGGSGFGDPRLVERQVTQAFNAVFVDAWRAENGKGARFVRAYEAATERPPGPLAAHAYDATRILCREVKQGGDRDTMRRRLLAMKRFNGVLGRTRFNGDGDAVFDLFVYTLHPEDGVVPRRGDRPPRN